MVAQWIKFYMCFLPPTFSFARSGSGTSAFKYGLGSSFAPRLVQSPSREMKVNGGMGRNTCAIISDPGISESCLNFVSSLSTRGSPSERTFPLSWFY